LPKSSKAIDSRNKKFVFNNITNDISESNNVDFSAIEKNRKIDLENFFKRLQQDIDRRKLSND